MEHQNTVQVPEFKETPEFECPATKIYEKWNPLILQHIQGIVAKQPPIVGFYRIQYFEPTYYGADINIVRKARSIEEAYLIFREYLFDKTQTYYGNYVDLIDEDIAWLLFNRKLHESELPMYVKRIMAWRQSNDYDFTIVRV